MPESDKVESETRRSRQRTGPQRVLPEAAVNCAKRGGLPVRIIELELCSGGGDEDDQ